MKTRDMAYISISAALIALCAWLSVPAAIPFTMQTFAVLAACVVPFIPADAAKIFLAATLSRRLAPLCAPERRRR